MTKRSFTRFRTENRKAAAGGEGPAAVFLVRPKGNLKEVPGSLVQEAQGSLWHMRKEQKSRKGERFLSCPSAKQAAKQSICPAASIPEGGFLEAPSDSAGRGGGLG